MGEVEAQAEGTVRETVGGIWPDTLGEGPVRKAGSRDRHDDRRGES